MQLKSIITSFFFLTSLLTTPVLTADNQQNDPIIIVGSNFDNDFLSLGFIKNGTAVGIALASTGFTILGMDRPLSDFQNDIKTELGWSFWLYGASTLLYVASTSPSIQQFVINSDYHKFAAMGFATILLVAPALLF